MKVCHSKVCESDKKRIFNLEQSSVRSGTNPIIQMMKEGGNSVGRSQRIVKISKPHTSFPLSF